ncbi:5602_t:CDS:2 [Diversispora eburnea]|uniref:5602_t:CDS:1 n=2 Tax=Diversisporales TaxID=214509 RepID=A0A9N8VJZ7_9GLOM|nr:5602_t:CDS:2 [Diversispora eburnea]
MEEIKIMNFMQDPWARREAWRAHPRFSRANVIRNAWPGFTWGLGAFLIYLGYDALSTRGHLGGENNKPHSTETTSSETH